MIQDVNKRILDHVFEKQSDYFILDILDARLTLMRKGNHYFTKDPKVKLEEMSNHMGLNTYNALSPFSDITMEQWKNCIDKLSDAIQKHYTLNQIILNVHYGVKKYTNHATLQDFSPSQKKFVEKYNYLIGHLFEILRQNLDGCHVIDFPDHVIADKNHWLGLHTLHYHNIYYDYAAEAIKVILNNMPDNEEKSELEQLKNVCSERFESMQMKMEFDLVKRKSEWRNHALTFTSELALDCFGDGNFIKWLEKNQRKKVALLKCQDTAGQILVKGLNKYGCNIVFSTQDPNFDKLTDEQISLCKKADIIISANVHSKVAPQRDGIYAIPISDLLKSDNTLETYYNFNKDRE